MPVYINLKNTVIMCFLLYYISAVLWVQVYAVFSLDENGGEIAKIIFKPARYSLEPFGLYTVWDFFSGSSKIEWIFITRGYADGFSAYYTPEFQTAAFQIDDNKDGKFYHNMVSVYWDGIRTSYLKSFCGKFEKEYGRSFNKVTLYGYNKLIPELNSSDPIEMRGVKKWTVEC